jgi:hypothetical protein
MATASRSMNEPAYRTKSIKNTAAVYAYRHEGQGFFSNFSDEHSNFWAYLVVSIRQKKQQRPHADKFASSIRVVLQRGGL